MNSRLFFCFGAFFSILRYMTHDMLYDPIRQKDVPATPEEHVRQATIKFLMDEVKVPQNLIAVEFGSTPKRTSISTEASNLVVVISLTNADASCSV